jgi:hypothetical protein
MLKTTAIAIRSFLFTPGFLIGARGAFTGVKCKLASWGVGFGGIDSGVKGLDLFLRKIKTPTRTKRPIITAASTRIKNILL